jgi:hypothetical protein
LKDPKSMLKVAKRLGVSTASVYVQLYDFYRSQRKRQRHFHDGRYWVRMPYEDFPRMFPELPASAVSEILGELEDKGLLRMVHYGSLSWYAINRISRRVV